MRNVRIWFVKQNTAKFISHLDTCRTMERAIHMSKLPFWYTEGYNPHVFLTINMPISLGYTGLRESMDVKLLDDNMPLENITIELNKYLPVDIQVFDVTVMVLKPGAIAYSEYEILLEDENNLYQKSLDLLNKDEIVVTKKTKKGPKDINIKDDFKDIKIEKIGDTLKYSVVLKSSNQGSINPRLFFEALMKEYDIKLYPQTIRVNSYDSNMKEFT